MKYSVKQMMRDSKKNECVICGKEFAGYGNNPWPVAKEGKCCDECNFDVVLPARLAGNSRKVQQRDSLRDLDALIASEKEAIELYTTAIRNAGDGIEQSIYEEILKDEKDHLEKLDALRKGYNISASIK